ncbi:YkgJ family cysteine cluster protein [Pseudomonas huanghezhanensis]|uniref:YkgJ family cysteine cluster protein n=1 Tax=Pseudomonas huanghezhanensis TaxID=3002903 RepID=UPI002286A373|nr:YkgJ family cysteine cluster protein [Pseudomonas sp. BSw22131]
MDTQFSCVGCGKCCTDHHVPLTLSEAMQWAADGGSLIVLTEAFMADGYGISTEQLTHATRRSQRVKSGSADVYVAITFAAFNAGRCRHLDAQDLCRIYERRPLVCRIYPMEINPHIPLRPQAKDCPPEAWTQGPELIVGNALVDHQLMTLIEQSRQADRDDIARKETICAALGIQTTALKGNGFVAYLPDMQAFIAATEQSTSATASTHHEWRFRILGDEVENTLRDAGALLETGEPSGYTFIPLQSA